MRKKNEKLLQSERARRVDDAARLLGNNDVEGAKKNLDWVDACSSLLAFTQHADRRKWSVIILFSCIVLVGVAWQIPVCTNHISINATTGNVVMTLNKDWICNQTLAPKMVRINNRAAIEPQIIDPLPAIESMTLQGKGITLRKLTLKKGARVELDAKGTEFRLFVTNSPISGELDIQDAEISIDTEGGKSTSKPIHHPRQEPPDTISFKVAQTYGVPFELTFIIQDNWRLNEMQIERLGFVEEYPLGSGTFVSTLRSGAFKIMENNVSGELHETDYLALEKATSRRLEISKADNGIKVLFEGSAARIFTGPRDYQEDLTPRLLEYLYHHQLLKIFWGAVVMLSGILWQIRDTLLGSKP